MSDTTTTRSRVTRWAGAAGLLAAGAIAGGVLAGTLSANAATDTTSPTSSSATDDGTGHADHGTYPEHGTDAHEALETPVTGDAATQAQAAAVDAVGGGTAGDVTADVSGAGYEVTVTQADGSTADVHLNASFGVDDHGRTGD